MLIKRVRNRVPRPGDKRICAYSISGLLCLYLSVCVPMCICVYLYAQSREYMGFQPACVALQWYQIVLGPQNPDPAMAIAMTVFKNAVQVHVHVRVIRAFEILSTHVDVHINSMSYAPFSNVDC